MKIMFDSDIDVLSFAWLLSLICGHSSVISWSDLTANTVHGNSFLQYILSIENNFKQL